MSLSQRRGTNAARVRSGLNAPEQREFPKHRKWIRGFACPVCQMYMPEGTRMECAHVRLGTDGGVGLKPSDIWCIPLCDKHHAEQHRIGEASFAAKYRAAFPKGLKAKALEYALGSKVQEVRDRAKREQG